MTIEEARRILSVSPDADTEAIRIRFAAWYTLSDKAYDDALTEGMKALHEQQLRMLEEAYKVLTDTAVIQDMGALLSQGKGYVADAAPGRGQELNPSEEEALAFFALDAHASALDIETRYKQCRKELTEAMAAVKLEASKEPFRKALEHAETYLKIAISRSVFNHALASGTLEKDDGGIDAERFPDTPKHPNVPFTKRVLLGCALLLLGAMIGFWCWHNRSSSPKLTSSMSRDNQIDSVIRKVVPQPIPIVRKAEKPVATIENPKHSEKKERGPSAAEARKKLADLVSKYSNGYHLLPVADAYSPMNILPAMTDSIPVNRSYIAVSFGAVDTLDTRGLVLYPDKVIKASMPGKPDSTVRNIHEFLSEAGRMEREEALTYIRLLTKPKKGEASAESPIVTGADNHP